MRFTQAPGSPSSALQTIDLGCGRGAQEVPLAAGGEVGAAAAAEALEAITSAMTSSWVMPMLRARPE